MRHAPGQGCNMSLRHHALMLSLLKVERSDLCGNLQDNARLSWVDGIADDLSCAVFGLANVVRRTAMRHCVPLNCGLDGVQYEI